MSDTLVGGTTVYVKDAGSTPYGAVPAPSANQITWATAAYGLVSSVGGVDIDDLLPGGRVDIHFVPPSFFSANGWSAGGDAPWGYTPKRGTSFVNNKLGAEQTKYTVLHETGHSIDPDVMNRAKRSTVSGLMSPAPNTSVSGYWTNGAYLSRPDECFADTFPRAYAGITDELVGSEYDGGWYYQRHIPATGYSTYKSTVGGAGRPADTTLAAAAAAGATNIKLTSVTGFNAGDWIQLTTDPIAEEVLVSNVGTSGSGGTGLTVSPLAYDHSSGDAVVESPGPSAPGGDGSVDAVVTINTPSSTVRAHQITGLPLGASGTVKIRFYDGKDWGDYSDPAVVALGVTPGRPTNVGVTPATLTPTFRATLNSPDPSDYITHYHIDVQQVIAGAYTMLMNVDQDVDPGEDLRTVSIDYDGNVGGPLAWDQNFVFIINLTNKYGITVGMASYQAFTPTVDSGPLITYDAGSGYVALDTSYKIDTETPTFRLADPNGSNIDEARIRAKDSTGTTVLYDSGVVSFTSAAHKDLTIPVDELVWGQNVQVDGAVRVTGDSDLGNFNDQPFSIHINATPGAPAPVSLESDTDQVVGPGSDLYAFLGRTDGVWVTTTDQPVAVFPNRDTDIDLGYEDDPTRREIELRDSDDDQVGASPYVITSDITDEWQIPDSLLTLDDIFKTRARYDDSADVRSSFSSYMPLKYSNAPTLADVTPADGDIVTDPTPTFAGTYDSASGKDMAAQRLTLSIASAVILDSDLVAASTPELTALLHVLDTGETVSYAYSVYDTDGLAATVFGTFTTAFTKPDAIEGLVVTPDPGPDGSDSLIVDWTGSSDLAFEEYFVYIKSGSKQYQLVGTITDPDQTELYIYNAPHNAQTIVRVTQSNGWAESDPAEMSAELGDDPGGPDYLHDYWFIRPDAVIQLPSARTAIPGKTAHGQGDSQTDLEVFDVPGRGEKVILDWGTSGYEATISLLTKDRDLVRTLRGWKTAGSISIFKTPYGSVRFVRLTSVKDTDQPGGWIQVDITYIEVAAVALEIFNAVTA
jgi:hypothetical protein